MILATFLARCAGGVVWDYGLTTKQPPATGRHSGSADDAESPLVVTQRKRSGPRRVVMVVLSAVLRLDRELGRVVLIQRGKSGRGPMRTLITPRHLICYYFGQSTWKASVELSEHA